MTTLNLGILAHVDAGKTSLTERLLHAAGVIDEPGSVDAGSTHTDFLDLERQRGITIKAAVVSFALHGVTVNLIDTPGHPDFIAEVERALGVLDGAVLVISAVEGVQAQTRILMRTLRRLGIPTLLFVNKIDRVGASEEGVLQAVTDRLTPSIVPMGTTSRIGTRGAAFRTFAAHELDVTALADHDDAVLAALVEGTVLAGAHVHRLLRDHTARATVHPVFFGSAKTGAGIDGLTRGITVLLPAAGGDPDGPTAASVFKIDRGPSGERVALMRVFSGTVRVRDRFGDDLVTAVEVFHQGSTEPRQAAVAGEIAKVWGLGDVRIGDVIGERRGPPAEHQFSPPTLEAVVVPRQPGDRHRLHTALTQLAEQDPLIDLRQGGVAEDLHVSLYGEVQKEVIQATLAADHGVVAEFLTSSPICVERPTGRGVAVEHIPRGRSAAHPFLAGIGLRVDPAPPGSGVRFGYEIELGSLLPAFMRAIAETVPEALRQGLYGWEVTDCTVTLVHSAYYPRQSHAHQRFSKAMSSVANDFRLLTPLVLLTAVRRAGTVVCEPIHWYDLEIPADTLPTVVPALARLGAPPLEQTGRRQTLVLAGHIRAAHVHDLQRQLPELTRGEGTLECGFDSFRPVRGAPPRRPRTDHNPLNREEYLLHVRGAF